MAESAPIPDWPPDAGADNGRDERALASLAEYLKLDENDWLEAVERTRRLVRDEDFQRISWSPGRWSWRTSSQPTTCAG
jgi:hypothetical protein